MLQRCSKKYFPFSLEMNIKRAYLRRPKKATGILPGFLGRKYRDGDTPIVITAFVEQHKLAAGAKKEKNEQITFHHQAC